MKSGAVTASTAFVDAKMSTQGFEQATADFQQCLGQLDLVTGVEPRNDTDQPHPPE
jgi:hypothetical protein